MSKKLKIEARCVGCKGNSFATVGILNRAIVGDSFEEVLDGKIMMCGECGLHNNVYVSGRVIMTPAPQPLRGSTPAPMPPRGNPNGDPPPEPRSIFSDSRALPRL